MTDVTRDRLNFLYHVAIPIDVSLLSLVGGEAARAAGLQRTYDNKFLQRSARRFFLEMLVQGTRYEVARAGLVH